MGLLHLVNESVFPDLIDVYFIGYSNKPTFWEVPFQALTAGTPSSEVGYNFDSEKWLNFQCTLAIFFCLITFVIIVFNKNLDKIIFIQQKTTINIQLYP